MVRTLVWFRGKDLRLGDHQALHAARAGEVLCLFVLDPYFFAPERARELPHRVQVLLEGIAELQRALEARGSRLLLAAGKSVDVVPDLARTWRVDRVVAQRWTEPFARQRDELVKRALDVPFDLFDGETLAAPGAVRNAKGEPYAVYSPFARAHRAGVSVGEPLPAPRRLVSAPCRWEDAALPSLAALGIPHNPRLPPGGERAARERMARFFRSSARAYAEQRDRLDLGVTSRLSVDLHFGTLSPRAVWCATVRVLGARSRFADELLWREFAHAVLWERPELLESPRRPEYATHRRDARAWRAWCEGATGYPVVDAAARQLLKEGFVHNRARMIAASFLTKDLGIDYRQGEAHYLKYLADGDWAQNNFNWQWVAGCGFDAAPYFRVFNPVEQARRFDPSGTYVRRWVPEVARLPDAWVHGPWTAPTAVLHAAGIALGKSYPRPVVDHAEARTRYLARMG